MSEHHAPKTENHKPTHEASAEHQKHAERLREKIEKAHAETIQTDQEAIDEIKYNADTHALSGKEVMSSESESAHQPTHQHVNQKELKADSFNNSIKQVRKKLKAPDKAFSKIIHTKAIENISEVGAKTIARPSGILGGGIVALAGSAFLLYMSSHYGFEYNYFIFFMLIFGGFLLGMTIELLARTFFHRKNQSQ